MDIVKYMSYGLLIGVPVAVTFCEKIGCPAAVSGPSMRPTLNPVISTRKSYRDDIVWVSKLHWNRNGARPGDVIAFISPINSLDRMVKRIIAVEREIVLNHKRQQVLISDGHLWVEGDNSQRSSDCNSFGPICKGLVIGTVTHVIWPPHRMQKIEHNLSSKQCNRRLHNEFDDKPYL